MEASPRGVSKIVAIDTGDEDGDRFLQQIVEILFLDRRVIQTKIFADERQGKENEPITRLRLTSLGQTNEAALEIRSKVGS